MVLFPAQVAVLWLTQQLPAQGTVGTYLCR